LCGDATAEGEAVRKILAALAAPEGQVTLSKADVDALTLLSLVALDRLLEGAASGELQTTSSPRACLKQHLDLSWLELDAAGFDFRRHCMSAPGHRADFTLRRKDRYWARSGHSGRSKSPVVSVLARAFVTAGMTLKEQNSCDSCRDAEGKNPFSKCPHGLVVKCSVCRGTGWVKLQ
jgi:hypothetical protein